MRPTALLLALALLAGCSTGSDSRPAASGTPSVTGTGSQSAPASEPGAGSPSASPALPPLPPRSGPPKLALVGGFANPTHVASPPADPRLFVVEQGGRVRVVKDGRTLPTPFLDIRSQVRHAGEQGMLSIAFAPDFGTSKRFYVDYNGTDGAVRVVEYRVGANPDRADPRTARELLRIPKPFGNHNGGQLVFDAKGMLLVSVGDGGGGNDPNNNAQSLGTLLGKLLRIDPRPGGGRPYRIPPDNPFVGRSGARPEIWAYGLRNPWRFAFDDQTGDLYVGDVGQYAVEELNAVPPGRQAGANYGWRVFEGRRRNFGNQTPNPVGPLIGPVHQFGHDGGKCVITSGVVYRGSVTRLRDRFLFGEYCTGALWSIPAGTRDRPPVATLPIKGPQVSSFGVDARGEVYVVSSHGEVWRITA